MRCAFLSRSVRPPSFLEGKTIGGLLPGKKGVFLAVFGLQGETLFLLACFQSFPRGILLGPAKIGLAFGRRGVGFHLFGFERGGGVFPLAKRRMGPEVFPFLGELFLDLVISRLASTGVKLFGPCFMIELGRLLRYSERFAIAPLLFVNGLARRRLRLQKVLPFLVLTRTRRGRLAGLAGVRPFFFPVGLDDPVVVLNAARLIEQAIGYRAIAARLVVAIEGIAFFLERLRLRSDRNLRLAVDPLLFKRARIVTDVEAGALHDLVE